MFIRRTSLWFAVVFALLSAAFLAGCGTSSSHYTQPPPPPPPPAEVKVQITPSSASTVINQGVQFTATVTGTSNTAVTWGVEEFGVGSAEAGLFRAPINGTFHVIATSVADRSKSARAEVAVSAPFLFIQQYTEGDAQPFSVTPIVGEFGADAKFTATNIIDSCTGKPISAAASDIFLSPDASKGVFTLVDTINDPVNGTYYVTNIYTGTADGLSSITPLTSNSIEGQDSGLPQYTPDGKQIIYVNYDPATAACDWEIWIMNADGSAKTPLYPNPNCDATVYHPTVSPDMTKVAFERWSDVGDQPYDGIAIMNMDGSNIVQLTGGSSELCPVPGTFYWDESPSFTADGKQLIFDRHCDPTEGGGHQLSVYSINIDGTGLKPLVTSTTDIKNADPLVVGDKIVFSSDMDTPHTGQFDMYSVLLDGSGLTRLTNNALFDAFTIDWMSGGYASQAARSAAQKRSARVQSRIQSRAQGHRAH